MLTLAPTRTFASISLSRRAYSRQRKLLNVQTQRALGEVGRLGAVLPTAVYARLISGEKAQYQAATAATGAVPELEVRDLRSVLKKSC